MTQQLTSISIVDDLANNTFHIYKSGNLIESRQYKHTNKKTILIGIIEECSKLGFEYKGEPHGVMLFQKPIL